MFRCWFCKYVTRTENLELRKKKSMTEFKQYEGSINMGIIMINHKLEKRIEYLKSVLSNEEYISKICEFYKKTRLWFNQNMFNEDDILCSMGIFYRNTMKDKDLLGNDFNELIYNVLKDCSLTEKSKYKNRLFRNTE